MEKTPSFELNRAIEHWRATLAQSPAFGTENLDELESHLRDSIAPLESLGLSEEEAFLIAVRRCGNFKQLETEFAKGRPIGRFRKIFAAISALLALIFGTASYPLFYLIDGRYAIMGIDSSLFYHVTTSRGWVIFVTDLLITLALLWTASALLRGSRRHALR